MLVALGIPGIYFAHMVTLAFYFDLAIWFAQSETEIDGIVGGDVGFSEFVSAGHILQAIELQRRDGLATEEMISESDRGISKINEFLSIATGASVSLLIYVLASTHPWSVFAPESSVITCSATQSRRANQSARNDDVEQCKRSKNL